MAAARNLDNINSNETDESAILLLHTEYGKDKVGSSFLNRQVSETVKENEPDIPVFITVLHATQEDIQDAQQDGVKLLLPKLHPDDPRIEPTPHWLTFDHRTKYPHLPPKVRSIVGHADVTGRAALNIKDDRCPEAKVILIHNDISDDSQGNETATGSNSVLKNAQRADVVFSVGNKIFEYFENEFRASVDKKPEHSRLLPRHSKIFDHRKATYKNTGTMTVLSISRLKSVDNLKGHDVVAKALDIAALRLNVKCRIRGFNEGTFQAGDKDILQTHFKTKNLEQTTILPYGTLKELHSDMLKAHLVLIPSSAESIEVVGLDAIAAGIPILVSDKSGLAAFMNKISKEFYHSTVPMTGNEKDNVKQWARCIEKVLSHCEAEFERAAKFRDTLLSAKYWEESHQQLIASCIQTGESPQQPSEVQAKSAPPIEEFIESSKPLKPGDTHQPAAGAQKRKRSSASIDETLDDRKSFKKGKPPLVPIVVEILKQVMSSLKTAKDMVTYAKAKETLVNLDITNLDDDTHEILQNIKPTVKSIPDLLNMVEATEILERIANGKVAYTGPGSIVFYLQCTDLSGLGRLWFMYRNGKLNTLLHSSLISEETLQQLGTESISVKATINKEDFRKALVYILTSPAAKGLKHTISVDNMMALPTSNTHLDNSNLRGLDLVSSKPCTSIAASTLNFTAKQAQTAVHTSKVRLQQQLKDSQQLTAQLQVQLQTLQQQLHTAREEAEAMVHSLKKEVARLTKRDEKAQKILLEHKEKIQQQETEIHQLRNANNIRRNKIEELTIQNTELSSQLSARQRDKRLKTLQKKLSSYKDMATGYEDPLSAEQIEVHTKQEASEKATGAISRRVGYGHRVKLHASPVERKQPSTRSGQSVFNVHMPNPARSSGKQLELHIPSTTQTENSQDLLETNLDNQQAAGNFRPTKRLQSSRSGQSIGTSSSSVDTADASVASLLSEQDRESSKVGGLQAEAKANHEKALAIYEVDAGNETDISVAYKNLASSLALSGQVSDAKTNYESALAVAMETENKTEQMDIYCKLGDLHREQLHEPQESHKYYTEMLALARDLGRKEEEGLAYNRLGRAHYDMGEHEESLGWDKKALKIRQERGEETAQITAHQNIADSYKALGKLDLARSYYQSAMTIAMETGNKTEQMDINCKLGDLHRKQLHEPRESHKYNTEMLALARDLGRKDREGLAYKKLGLACEDMRDYKAALGWFQRHLKMSQETEDKTEQITAHVNTAESYKALGKLDLAISHYQSAMTVAMETGNKAEQMDIYCMLGDLHRVQLHEPQESHKYYTEMLALARDLGRKEELNLAYNRLGLACCDMQDYEAALEWFQKYLKMSQETEDKNEQITAHVNTADSYKALGKLDLAISHYQSAMTIAMETGNKQQQEDIYCKLGDLHMLQLHEPQESHKYYTEMLALARDLGRKDREGQAYNRLGRACCDMQDHKAALEWFQKYLKMSQETEDKNKQITAHVNTADSYKALGKLDLARSHYQSAMTIAMETGSKQQQGDIAKRLANL